MAKLGVWLAFQLEGLLYGICVTIGILFGSYLLGGIWGAWWAGMINTELYLKLEGAIDLRDRVVASAVLSWGVFFCVAVLLYFLYFHGYSFRCHSVCAALTVVCGVAVVVMWGMTMSYVTEEQRERVRVSFLKLLASGTENAANNWLKEHDCSTIEQCSDKIDLYLTMRGKVGYIANIVLLVLWSIGFIGIAIVLILMALVKPVNRDTVDGPSGSDEDVAIGDEKSQASEAVSEDKATRRRESEIL